ncbi:MAG: Serine/threonine-protein kinase PK-1 [Firmicutes bacterium ADurb.Bin373]|nr:MAG: Serine/threonine-protein kinase PK-1 [Firmicutes bacterium ADurb.Bin373]
MFDLSGRTIGRYRIGERLGQGGMAQVYKAYQPGLDRYVALKILHPHLTTDEDFAMRFQREGRAIAALEHPNIVRVYDFDTVDDLTFLVMEYLEGISLKARLRELANQQEQMALPEVVAIVYALAEALEYAEAIVETVREPLVVLDADLRVKSANKSFFSTFAVTSGQTLGRNIFELGNGQWDIPKLRSLLEGILAGNIKFEDFEVIYEFPQTGRKKMLVNASRLFIPGNQTKMILMTIDIRTLF